MKLFKVQIMRGIEGSEQILVTEFYHAENIQAVIGRLAIEFQDAAAEVMAIVCIAEAVTTIPPIPPTTP